MKQSYEYFQLKKIMEKNNKYNAKPLSCYLYPNSRNTCPKNLLFFANDSKSLIKIKYLFLGSDEKQSIYPNEQHKDVHYNVGELL